MHIYIDQLRRAGQQRPTRTLTAALKRVINQLLGTCSFYHTCTHARTHAHARTHTHTPARLTALFPGLPRWAGCPSGRPTNSVKALKAICSFYHTSKILLLLLLADKSDQLAVVVQGWVVASDSVLDSAYTVRGLQPDTSYMFLVRAQNSHGLSLPSPVTTAVRTRGKPFGYQYQFHFRASSLSNGMAQ